MPYFPHYNFDEPLEIDIFNGRKENSDRNRCASVPVSWIEEGILIFGGPHAGGYPD